MTRLPWLAYATLAASLATLAGCIDQPVPTSPVGPAPSRDVGVAATDVATPQLIRQLAAGRGIVSLPPAPHVRSALSRLGQALVFDPILSGNRNISCATCHLPSFATGDGKSLSVGEGGIGFGPPREHPNGVFIARNAPPFFNLAAMRHLFWDGRIEVDSHGMVHTPAGAQVTAQMQGTFEFGPVSALGMFPVTNRAEMRGQMGTNELAVIADDDFQGMWAALMRRLGAIPEYRDMFGAAYPDTRFEDLTFAHAANAIGGFIVDRFTFDQTPFDQLLAGNDRAMTQRQLDGAQTFLTLKCSLCHNGATLGDEQFHDVAVAQVGPGEGDGLSGRDDFGRMRVTGDPGDQYRFRTSPLRNVELTGPFGHDGAFTTLRGFVDHYSQSDLKLLAFDPFSLEPALSGTLLPTSTPILAQRDTLLAGVVIPSDLVDRLMDYMSALTDPAARDLSPTIPRRVPSGLPVLPPRP